MQALVEKLDDVEDLMARLVERGPGAKLQQAAGVGSDDRLSGRGLGVTHLLREQFE